MYFLLSLVIYFSNGSSESFNLKSFNEEKCIDVRDELRKDLGYYNDLIEKSQISVDKQSKVVVEFLDAECSAQEKFN